MMHIAATGDYRNRYAPHWFSGQGSCVC